MQRHEYHIEQRVHNPLSAIDTHNDRIIRARDGYAFVMAIKPTQSVPCEACGTRCRVPELRSAEIVCAYCEQVKSRRGRYFGAYWPLTGDLLINYLKKLDPERDGHLEAAYESDVATAAGEAAKRKATMNTIEAATLDDKYQLFGTPFVGYTKPTFEKAS